MGTLFKGAVALLLLAAVFLVDRAPVFIRGAVVVLLCLLSSGARPEDGAIRQNPPSWLKAYVEVLGCVLAEKAVRRRISPMPVAFRALHTARQARDISID